MGDTTAHALPVLYQDEVLALIDKPAGLMVHDSALARGERDFAADRLRAQFGRPIHLIHRLDRATSGCLLIAFEREVASALGRQFMSQSVDKHYLAVCRGWPAQDAFIVDHPLDGGPGKPEKKPARTAIRVLARGELDEPAAGMTKVEAATLASLITDIARDARPAVIVVEHDLELIRTVADRVVVLQNGGVLAEGTYAEVEADVRVQEAYLGTEAQHG